MRKLTAGNLVAFINQLKRNQYYTYINPTNKHLIKIEGIDLPEGPIRFKRWDPSLEQSESQKKIETISKAFIWRIANALAPDQPINLDRVLAGSYNTRSVIEALIANTPEFYFCYPGRIETKGEFSRVKHGHKHLVWKPDTPHAIGITKQIDTDIVISEVPALNAYYDSLVLSDPLSYPEMDINIQRRHAQIQIALYHIGKQLNYRTWIAQNDKGILYQNKRLAEYDGIISSLKDEKLISSFDDAIQAALLIDCIWFQNGHLMPAVMEIEHSTGVTSGLSRMLNFKSRFPPFLTRYVIVAPDEIRDKVIKEASKPQFKTLDARYFPYSAVEELYALCQKRKLKGITEDFLDCFMEPILN